MLDDLITGRDAGCPVFVHSDLMPVMISNQTDLRRFSVDGAFREVVMGSLYNQLQTLVGSRDLWLPAFNYD